jgi:hypothetical protein
MEIETEARRNDIFPVRQLHILKLTYTAALNA